ncbi:hypothetical protein LEP1GSC170_3554 [Leptospira interrogans serovar Bataviae str. HAI135]|nr:hypothetical protein LEP1GSC170_3554 [Leptospira interrogans serovar Bataviae str. HAI135]
MFPKKRDIFCFFTHKYIRKYLFNSLYFNHVNLEKEKLSESGCHRQPDRALRSGQVIVKFQNQIQFL